MSYVSTWHKLWCPQCETSNFVDAGNQQDPTGYDPDGCKCWKCGHCFVIDDEWQDEVDESSCDDGEHLIDAKLFLEAIGLVEAVNEGKYKSTIKKKIKELKRKAGYD